MEGQMGAETFDDYVTDLKILLVLFQTLLLDRSFLGGLRYMEQQLQ